MLEQNLDISIHSPVWGETWSHHDTTIFIPNFNPLARMGRDIHLEGIIDDLTISIHSPAKGET
ncbi:Uncharacterised protein [Streptococcus equi subsp. zooepidemicus]|uniref:hypothetical protein n=1 Tax=Streptococcus equi TaxID=1336 RepID=UPI0010CACF2D|nr:Uncharacterised protein [Streptococcus equi subsp. zooepidemicus]